MKIKMLTASAVLAAGLFAAGGAMAQSVMIDQNGVQIVPQGREVAPPQGRWDNGPGRGPDQGAYDRGIGPREARRIARDVGLVNAYGVDRHGPVWVVDGADRRGRGIRVTISARSGDIVNVDRARRG